MAGDFFFTLFAVLAVLGALGLVIAKHPIHGAMSLIITMISLAGLYALLSAKLLFALQLIVYAGAIMSLVLFIIMFLNIRDEDLPEEKYTWWYLICGLIILIPMIRLLIRAVREIPGADLVVVPQGFGSVEDVGLVLFHNWLLPFEMVSILLLVALMGAVILAGKKGILK